MILYVTMAVLFDGYFFATGDLLSLLFGALATTVVSIRWSEHWKPKEKGGT